MNTDTKDSKDITGGKDLGEVDELIVLLWKNLFLNYFAVIIYPNFDNINHRYEDWKNDIYLNCEDCYIAQLVLDCIKYQCPFGFDYFKDREINEEVYTLYVNRYDIHELLESLWEVYEEKDKIVRDFVDHLKTNERLWAECPFGFDFFMDFNNKYGVYKLIAEQGHIHKLYEILWNDFGDKDSIINEFGKFMKSSDKYWIRYKARERYFREQLAAEVVATESSN